MKAKIFFCGLCRIASIERPDALIESDKENKRYSAQFFIAPPREKKEGESDVLFSLLSKGVSQGRYNQIVTLSDAGMSPETHPLDTIRATYLGQNAFFTLFDANVTDLLSGTKYEGTTILNDGAKDLSKTFHSVRMGDASEQAETVFDQMRASLLQRIENGTYFVGSIADEEKETAQ